MRSLDCGLNAKATNTISVASNILRVTQGDPEGIGLEVFFKSFILLQSLQQKSIVLYANQKVCQRVLENLGIPFVIKPNRIDLSNAILKLSATEDNALDPFVKAINDMQAGDVLFTLPASKKSFPAGAPGHTAYLRNYSKRSLGMFFHAGQSRVLLLTDHIELSKVRDSLTSDSIIGTVSNSLQAAKRFLGEAPKNIIFSGVNPHAGEGGVLGDDEQLFAPVIKSLTQKFPTINFMGPLSGDTMFNRGQEDTWLVYAHHDQALAPFKSRYHYLGANITLGLDFLRLSVDHGTAPDKYGLNISNYMGCYYCLELAYKSLGRK